MLALRRQGVGNIETGERLGVPAHSVAQELYRLRALGFDVPPDPHPSGCPQSAAEHLAVTNDLPAICRALIERGVHVPRPTPPEDEVSAQERQASRDREPSAS